MRRRCASRRRGRLFEPPQLSGGSLSYQWRCIDFAPSARQSALRAVYEATSAWGPTPNEVLTNRGFPLGEGRRLFRFPRSWLSLRLHGRPSRRQAPRARPQPRAFDQGLISSRRPDKAKRLLGLLSFDDRRARVMGG